MYLTTIPYSTLPYPRLPYLTLPYRIVPYPALPYRTLTYLTVPHCTLPFPALPYRNVTYCTIPHPTDLGSRALHDVVDAGFHEVLALGVVLMEHVVRASLQEVVDLLRSQVELGGYGAKDDASRKTAFYARLKKKRVHDTEGGTREQRLRHISACTVIMRVIATPPQPTFKARLLRNEDVYQQQTVRFPIQ